ncbi:MAG: hypothetical protein WCD69_19295 [Xanthobacteraceae bacterium]
MLGWIAGEIAKPAIDVEDDAVGTGGERPVAHALDQNAIGLLGAMQQDDLRAFQGPHHDDGIDVTLMDCLDGLVGIVKQRQFGIAFGLRHGCTQT